MKKYSVLFAALAVIALAGCKKEESRNMNGIIIGGETYQNIDKQVYSPDFQYVMFDGTDGILFNGVGYTYTMIDNPIDRNEVTTYSNFAMLNINVDPMPEDVTLLYPANIFFGEDLYVSPSASSFTMVDETPNAGVPNTVTGCIWPMGYHTDNFHSHGQIQLKNAVAIITASVKYGLPCFTNLRVNNPDFANVPAFNTLADLPQMDVTKVELMADRKLTGDAHIEFDAEDIPAMVMDEALAEGDIDVLAATAPNGSINIPAAGNNEKYAGSIPVTPNLIGANMWMKVYFDLTFANGDVFHCVYATPESAPVSITAGRIMRSYRTFFIANMFTAQNWNRINVISIDRPVVEP